MSQLKLVYFNIGGRAACIRNALKIGKIDFVDEFVTFAEFGSAKAADAYTFGSVPVFYIGDTQITQSNAILRWVGKQAGLYPTDLTDSLYVDEVVSAVEDCYGLIGPSMHEKDEAKKLQMRQELVEGKLKAWLAGLAKLAERNGSNGFFVGEKGTIADLKALQILEWLSGGILDGIPKTILDQFPVLLKAKTTAGDWVKESTK